MKTNLNKNNLIKKKNLLKYNKNKKKNILKSDKRNSIVDLMKDEYIERMKSLISTGSYNELRKNPLNKIIREAMEIINIPNLN